MTIPLPLFYFKPTICWIDDDQLFLDAVSISFQEKYNHLSFTNPCKALQFLQSYQSPLANLIFKHEFSESDVFGTNDRYPVDINIPSIKNIVNLTNRRNEIAVLVIDYNMPEINGLDVCKQLRELPIKKILLTGGAAQHDVIEAFNLGIIDRFIMKDHNSSEKLTDYINSLTHQFFHQKTADIISHIETSRPSLLSDSVFINLFYHWCQSHNITEFYLINKQGSFLLKDNDNHLFYFVVMSERDKNEFLKFNDELFESESSLLKQVSKGEMIPFFGVSKESWQVAPDEWHHCFYPAQIVTGREAYYWTVING